MEHNAEKLQEIWNGIKQGIIYTHKSYSEGAENKERKEQEKSESTESFKNVCVMFQEIIRILNTISMNVRRLKINFKCILLVFLLKFLAIPIMSHQHDS